jgi:hypothetical protein
MLHFRSREKDGQETAACIEMAIRGAHDKGCLQIKTPWRRLSDSPGLFAAISARMWDQWRVCRVGEAYLRSHSMHKAPPTHSGLSHGESISLQALDSNEPAKGAIPAIHMLRLVTLGFAAKVGCGYELTSLGRLAARGETEVQFPFN